MSGIVRLIRPEQWIKNLFVFLPLFFSGNILNVSLAAVCFVAFLSFCMISSSIYCLNDIIDADFDRNHPKKKNRPIASGKVSKTAAFLVMAILIACSFALELCCGGSNKVAVAEVIGGYLILNLAYSLRLKRIAIIDVTIIALGFVLRLIAGGLADEIFVSQWIIIMTFLLALFLALAKRRDDALIFEKSGVKARSNIFRYNVQFLNQAISIIASVMLVSYIIYSVSADAMTRIGSPYLYSTSIFVLLGILRYMQLTIVDSKSGSPTRLIMRDHFLQACVCGWILLFIIIIYL